MHDNKNTLSKATLKRNLFGDHDEDSSSPVLAKKLTDSPQQCSFLNDPAIQSIKCTDFSYKAKSMEKEVKGILNAFINLCFNSIKLKQSLFKRIFITSNNTIFFYIYI